MTKDQLLDQLIKQLNECIAFGQRPDEYQQRHNSLIRQLAAYVVRDEIDKFEGNDE
jgi:hypothetical protein